MQQYRKREIIALVLSFLVLLFSCVLIFNDRLLIRVLNFNFHGHKESSIGLLQTALNARLKPQGGLAWMPAAQSDRIHAGDSLFTGSNGSATIAMNNGGQISIGANSLVLMSNQQNELDLNIQYGSVVGQIAANQKVRIRMDGKVAELQGSNARIRIEKVGARAKVEVLSGEVQINSGGHKKTLRAKAGGATTAKNEYVFHGTIHLLGPAPGQSVWLLPNQRRVQLKWTSIAVRRFRVEVSTSPDFNADVFKTVSASRDISLVVSKKWGSHLYWRVSSLHNPIAAKSDFYIKSDIAPNLTYPSSQARIWLKFDPKTSQPVAQPVPFQWQDSTGATKFQLQIAHDPKFKSIVVSNQVAASPYNSQPMVAGQYFWRLRDLDPSRPNSPWSAVSAFSIEVTPPPNAPVLRTSEIQSLLKTGVRPSQLAELPPAKQQDLMEKNLLNPPNLSWKPIAGAKVYHVQIAKASDPHFKYPVFDKQTKFDQASWGLARPGSYIWRVFDVNPSGQWSAPSRIGKLQLASTEPHATSQNAFRDRVPTAVDLNTPRKRVPLTWTPVLGATSYQLQVATDPNFTQSKVYQLKNLGRAILPPNSQFYWRVRGLRGGAPVSPFSKVYQFDYQRYVALQTPASLFPGNSSTFMLVGNGRANILFHWTPVNRAQTYEFQLSGSKSFDSFLVNTKTYRPQILIQGNLGAGEYAWRVRAVNSETSSGWKSGHFLVQHNNIASDNSPKR